jgi:hypothetical protein
MKKRISLKQLTVPMLIITGLIIVLVADIGALTTSKSESFANGLTNAVAEKSVGSDWYEVGCHTRSYTERPTVSISHIGYNTFSCTAWRHTKSSGNVLDQWVSSIGELNYNSSAHAKPIAVNAPMIYGTVRIGVAAGSHDFAHYYNENEYHSDPLLSAEATFNP